MNAQLEIIRKAYDATYEDNGFYVYQATRNAVAFAKKGNRFCDHWEKLDEVDPSLKAIVLGVLGPKPAKAAKPKAKASVAKPKAKVLKAAEPGAVKAGSWTVAGSEAKSPKGRAWKVTSSDERGWLIESKSGCKGLLTRKGLWLAR